MTHRVISSDGHPSRLVEHIRSSGCIARREETAYRGPVAIVGGGRIYAVANLCDAKKINAKDASGFLWCFDDLREIAPIECACYGVEATFMNGGNLEPQFLNASAQQVLNDVLSGKAIEEAEPEPEMPVPVAPMPPDYQTDVPTKARAASEAVGQMELF